MKIVEVLCFAVAIVSLAVTLVAAMLTIQSVALAAAASTAVFAFILKSMETARKQKYVRVGDVIYMTRHYK